MQAVAYPSGNGARQTAVGTKKGLVPLAVFGLLMVGTGWFGHQLVGTPVRIRGTSPRTVPTVAVTEVRDVEFNPSREYVGRVQPMQEVDILPRIEGYVMKVCFAEGAAVKEGEVLFEIDDEQYAAALELKRANVHSAEAKCLVAEAEMDRATRYLDRLVATDMRGVPATERDAAEAAFASAKAALNSARANVAEAKAAVAIAEFDMKHTKVRAPITGRVGKAFRHAGDLVSPSKGAMAHIVQQDPIRVAVPVADRDYGTWRPGGVNCGKERRLRLVLPDGTFYAHTGMVDFSDNRMEASTSTVALHIRFGNPNGLLLPNQFVKLVVDDATPAKKPAIPISALVKSEEGWMVWVVGDDGKASRRTIVPGQEWQGWVAVDGGVVPGERVVSQGTHKVLEGSSVRVVGEGAAK